jgi:hypothetical protein
MERYLTTSSDDSDSSNKVRTVNTVIAISCLSAYSLLHTQVILTGRGTPKVSRRIEMLRGFGAFLSDVFELE